MKRLSMILAAAILLPGGCYTTSVQSGWQPLAGTEYLTQRGISFWWLYGSRHYLTPEDAAVAIDKAYVEWNSWYLQTYGSGIEPWRLFSQITGVDIQLIPRSRIPGNDDNAFTLGIWWESHKQIDVAMEALFHWDPAIGMYTQGLEVLKHEWTHVIRGAYHP